MPCFKIQFLEIYAPRVFSFLNLKTLLIFVVFNGDSAFPAVASNILRKANQNKPALSLSPKDLTDKYKKMEQNNLMIYRFMWCNKATAT
jgi:hypothetical protein